VPPPSRASSASAASALEVGLRLLGQRPHSEHELRTKLLARCDDEDEVESALARLRERGYLDDEDFARSLVSRRARARGPHLIAAELAAKGVAKDLARRAVGEVGREELVAAARRAVARMGDAEARVRAARLQRRGFPADVIHDVLAFDEEREP
jgi:regulatory protein